MTTMADPSALKTVLQCTFDENRDEPIAFSLLFLCFLWDLFIEALFYYFSTTMCLLSFSIILFITTWIIRIIGKAGTS